MVGSDFYRIDFCGNKLMAHKRGTNLVKGTKILPETMKPVGHPRSISVMPPSETIDDFINDVNMTFPEYQWKYEESANAFISLGRDARNREYIQFYRIPID